MSSTSDSQHPSNSGASADSRRNKVRVPISRPLVGFLAGACLLIGVAMLWTRSDPTGVWSGGFIRVGLLMTAFFFALPTRTRDAAWANVSPWTFVGLIAGIIALPRYPRVVIPLGVALLTIAFILKPFRRDPRTSPRGGQRARVQNHRNDERPDQRPEGAGASE